MDSMDRENIAGFDVDTLNVQASIVSVLEHLQAQSDVTSCKWLACINPHSFVQSLNDPLFDDALRDANWLIPDGSGIVLASALLGGSIKERVTGSDIFYGVSGRLDASGGGRVFFLGSTEETLAEIRGRMALNYPNLEVVGTYSPPFRPEYSDTELDEMVAAINSARPDVLWVGMTAPKQEKWIYELSPRLQVKFAAAIGAVFDFYTGNVKRSHPIFQRLHLEWLPRLVQQPKRLWRRMGVSAPIFVWHVMRQRLGLSERTGP